MNGNTNTTNTNNNYISVIVNNEVKKRMNKYKLTKTEYIEQNATGKIRRSANTRPKKDTFKNGISVNTSDKIIARY